MKKRNVFLIIFTAVILIAACITIAVCARESTANVFYFYYLPDITVTDTHYTTQNDRVELKEITTADGIVRATFVPKSVGSDTVEFYTETSDPNENANVTLRYISGPFGTIFSFNPLFDFKGSRYVICLFLLLTFVYAAVLLWAFVDYIRKSDFGYQMVACGGAGLFLIHYFAACTMTFINSLITHFEFGFGDYLMTLISSGGSFTRSIAVVMALFCAALIISNISLIRHEGFRPQNLLGVVLGVLWLTGTVIYRFFYLQSFVSVDEGYNVAANAISVVLSYFECMLLSTIFCAVAATRYKPPHNMDYIIILGCALNSDGTPTPLLRGRVERALAFENEQFADTGKHAKFVPSGGQGSDEVISEAESMKRCLMELGIPEERIIKEDRSVNTYRNMECSKRVIEQDAESFDNVNIAFSTTNYHVFRGYTLAKKVDMKVKGLSAKTKLYFFPNAFVREFIGLLWEQRRRHLLFAAFLIASAVSLFLIIVF